MAKIYLPKGRKTYAFRTRVPKKYLALVGRQILKESLGTQDRREAERLAIIREGQLLAQWEQQLKSVPAARIGSGVGAHHCGNPDQITAVAGYHFDDREHALAYFYEHQRTLQQFINRGAFERASLDPEAFWRGEVVPLPEDLDRDLPLPAALASALNWKMRASSDTVRSMLMFHELSVIKRITSAIFNPPHCDDPEFLIAVGRTYVSFLDLMVSDDNAQFDYLDEVDGKFVRRRVGGEFPLVSGSPEVQAVNRHPTLTPHRRAMLTPLQHELLRLQARSCGA